MAAARTENLGPVVMGLNKQNGQLRGVPKPASPQSGPLVLGSLLSKAVGAPQKAGAALEGTGIRYTFLLHTCFTPIVCCSYSIFYFHTMF